MRRNKNPREWPILDEAQNTGDILKGMLRKVYKGFTLIELLVVISIIGVLSSVVLASLDTVRTKAKASKLISDFQQIEQALIVWGSSSDILSWWHEDTWGAPTDEPTVTWLIQNTSFSEWMSGDPLFEGGQYVYDNDNDIFDDDGDGCGTLWRGPYVLVRGFFLAIAQEVDRQVDGGDGQVCGKIVWNTGGIGYLLGNGSQDIGF